MDRDVGLLDLTETLISNDIPTSHLEIIGYHFEERCRIDAQGGEIGVYVNQDLKYTRKNDLEIENIECLFIEISFPYSKSFIVEVMYRPPDSS